LVRKGDVNRQAQIQMRENSALLKIDDVARLSNRRRIPKGVSLSGFP